MKKLRNILLTGLLLLLLPLAALSGANTWTGTGPYATGLGNQIVNALATSPDGLTVYAGTGSGTVLSYEIVPPSVTTSAASGTSATGSTLNGSVNAQGGSFTTLFRYGTVSGVYPSSAAATPSPVTGSSATPISATLSALVPNTTYYYRAEATGGSTVQGSELSFTTGKLAPTASTGAATSVTSAAATLNATVNAQHDSTSISFEYGLSTAYGSTATASPATLGTSADTAVSAALSGLAASTTYHFRVVATNSTGTTQGADQSFTTAAAAPATATGSASSVTTASATLNGTVNANNASTAVTFEYGTTVSLGTSVAATPGTVTGGTITSVSAALSGLLPNTLYYFKVSATNAGGTVGGGTLSFTTPLPAPVASAATSLSVTGFSANWGAVSGATQYWLDVATDSGFSSLVAGYSNKDVGNATTAAVTGLASGTTYHYRVRAYNGTSTSASSNTISATTGASRTVTNTNDSGAGSLRQTIADANPGDTVTFAGGVTGTITLATTLSIDKDLTITGPGAAVLTVSGGAAVGIFQIPGANSLTLQNLTLSNGAAVGGAALVDSASANTTISGCVFSANTALGGGAILSSGTLTISDSTFSGNSASGSFGGAISASGGGTVAISNTLFSGNSAPAGGAIANGAASMTLTNVTLSGNTATTGGGAIYASNGTSLVALNTTIANNSTPGDGGGILAATGALVNLKNSIVASNTATASGPDIVGTVTSQGYNLFGSTSGATIGGDTTGNLTSGTPLLGALANNGGPTQTLALLSGSPAINAGTCTGAPATDQRGMARPQNGVCDIGAYEAERPTVSVTVSGTGIVADDTSLAGFTINCGATCSDTVFEGANATLTATPGAGYSFTGWSGDCSGIGNCALTNITANKSVTASFALNSYTITVNAGTGGTASCTPNPASHGGGSTCSATPGAGYSFTGWSGDCTGATCTLSNVTSARSVTASFTLNSYAVTVNAGTGGTASCTPNPVSHGGGSTCSATPGAGYSFTGWSGDCTGTTCALSNVTSVRSVTASFALNPYVFTFTAQTGAALSSVATSNSITVAGINSAANISIAGGTYSINGGGYTAAAGTVNDGDTVTVQQTASASYGTTTTATLTIGGVSGVFNVTTAAQDATPDPFSFTAQTNVALNSVATSNAITVAGINSAAAIGIVGGSYSINGGAYTAVAGTVNNGDTVTVRQTASASYSTLTTATLTIGGVAGAFNVTTQAAPAGTISYTAASATGTGSITASFTGGGAGCGYTVSQFIPLTGHGASPPAGTAPAGASFPHGLFDFTVSDCTPGSTITLVITYPQALPAGTVYWKYGPTPTDGSYHWYQLPATISGNTATFSITDGGLGDDDLTANGTIVDQGGPGGGGGGGAAAIPTLSEWALLLLAGLMGLFGMGAMRRRQA